MLSVEFIRDRADEVREALRTRHVDAPLDEVLRLDAERRRIIPLQESLLAERNAASKRIGQTKDPAERQRLIAEQQGMRERIDALEQERKAVEGQLRDALMQMPNMPLPEVPVGKDESENVVLRHGDIPTPELGFPARPHWEIGERLGIIDFDAGIKMSGSRFYVLKGMGALLQRALINLMVDMHVYEHGMELIKPPTVVKEECFWATGDLPKFLDNLYHDYEDDLWLIPTAEVPLTNIWRDEIIEPGLLPIRYVSQTACFRREKMSAGRDVRGIKRGHEFDKVEMYTYCAPERSMEEFDLMVRQAEAVCDRLELPHRILQLCTGDLGFKAGITYDIEVWAPGQEEWLEVSSVSNVLDFQARRANIRFRREPRGRPEFPHMLNGSGLALPRVVAAILENFQNEDGSVTVPVALRQYLRTDVIGNEQRATSNEQRATDGEWQLEGEPPTALPVARCSLPVARERSDPMRILAIDMGTGTQDILLFDTEAPVENNVKLVMPSATEIAARRIRRATAARRPVLLTGATMGGGPCSWALEAHLKAGLAAYATPEAAKTFDDDLDAVAAMGVTLVAEDEAATLGDAARIELRDLDLEAVRRALAAFEVETRFDGLALACLDHGAAPPGTSDRLFRFEHLRRVVGARNDLRAFAFLPEELPDYLTRARSMMDSREIDVPAIFLDTGPAAALGALHDERVRGAGEQLVLNLGNMHALAFHLSGRHIHALYEHHTGEMTTDQIESFSERLLTGDLTHEEVFASKGHGVYYADGRHGAPDVIAVTGPQRGRLRGSRLEPYFAAPHGDMMIGGCFGLLDAFAEKYLDAREAIEARLAR